MPWLVAHEMRLAWRVRGSQRQLGQDDGYVEVRRGVGMFVLPGAAEKLRRAECDNFVKNQWPRIRDYIDLLGLDAGELLERERV